MFDTIFSRFNELFSMRRAASRVLVWLSAFRWSRVFDNGAALRTVPNYTDSPGWWETFSQRVLHTRTDVPHGGPFADTYFVPRMTYDG